MNNILDIVNDNDEIIGQETREKIHLAGLCHREIHVYFITPRWEVIFQHRAKDKEYCPDLLSATVGGHVEIGDDYNQTAIKETEEETGVKIQVNDLIPVGKIKRHFTDKITDKINYSFSTEFAYIYKENSEDLKIESGKAIGFEVWPLERLLSLTDSEKEKFIPQQLEFVINELADFMNNFIIK